MSLSVMKMKRYIVVVILNVVVLAAIAQPPARMREAAAEKTAATSPTTSPVNEYTDEQILSSHVYNGNRVWLSSENQFNFKAAYDIAVQTNGANLPVTFKLGTDNEPDYVEFADLNSLAEFYFGCVQHINDCLKRGWDLKNSFNYEDYILPKEQQS